MSRKILEKDIFVVVGAGCFLCFIIMAIIIPFMGLSPPMDSSKEVLLSPSKEHILGTNDIGQDIFSRLLYGLRASIFTSVFVGMIATFIATILGTTAALIGGIFDRLILRLCDIFLALPEFIICLLVASYIRPSGITLILMISLLNWQGPLKVIRSQVMICKENLSVYAARTFGGNTIYLLKRHILPEIFPMIMATFIRNARIAVFMEVSLSYLGLVDPKAISLGKIMNNAMAFTYLDVWKWWLLPVGVVLSLFLLTLSYIGYYLENKRNVCLEERKS